MRIILVSLLFLASCESLGPENAQAVLQKFCALHRSEILHVLLSDEQIKAGNIVCGAIGLPLGVQ